MAVTLQGMSMASRKTKIISRFLKKEAEKSMTCDNWQGRIEYFEKSIDKFKSILEND